VPLYWLATFACIATAGIASPWPVPAVDAAGILRSLLFIPYFDAGFTVPTPILVPGWTLNLEMAFYAMFAIGLALRRPVLVASLLIVAMLAIGAFEGRAGALASTWTSPLLTRFLAGMLIGRYYLARGFAGWGMLLPLGVLGLIVSATPMATLIGHQAVLRGGSAMAVVVGSLALEGWFARHLPRLFRQLGDASYSLYLVHWPLLVVLRSGHKLLPASGWLQFAVWMIAACLLSIALGLLVHVLIERPIMRALSDSPPLPAPDSSAPGRPRPRPFIARNWRR
jgi:exopolysaccharide production protein ExoZ